MGMFRACAIKGYAPTTVADVVGIARVSRQTFYEQFESKEACFLVAQDLGHRLILAQVVGAARGESWEDDLARSLAKKPRFTPIEYHVGDVWVEVSANPKFGLATIWDADILIWASTQITEALDRGLTPSRVVRFHPHNLLKSIRRATGGGTSATLTSWVARS